MRPVYCGPGIISPFGKFEEKHLQDLLITTVNEILESIDPGKIDSVVVGSMSPDSFFGEGNLGARVADWLGLWGRSVFHIDNASAAGAAAFQIGAQMVAGGCFDNVLVIGCEKMTHLSTRRATSVLASVIDESERAAGASMVSLAALVTERYMYEYKMPYEALMKVAIKNHHHGYSNPIAHLKKMISMQDILNSRVIAEPLRLYDCSPISDGVAAVILTAHQTDVVVKGWGSGSDYVALRNRRSLTSFRATLLAAERAYSMAGLTPREIDYAEIHDAFTSFEIIGLEDLGFCEKGEGWKWVMEDRTEITGSLPVNITGGLKSRGHPVGASGVAQIVEILNQMRGRAGENQLERCERALAHSIGGLASSNFVTILEKVR